MVTVRSGSSGREGGGGQSFRWSVGGMCRVSRFFAYVVVIVQGRLTAAYPGEAVQGRSVLLQRVTAHSSTVAIAVAIRVQGKLVRDLPCSHHFRRL